MRKGAERGQRKEKETKRQFEVEGLRDPPFMEFSRQVGAQASKFGFYKLIDCIIKKICYGVKQNAKVCANGEIECNET